MNNRLIGAILLIAGTTIGAAMLALPVSTGRAGLIPSFVAFTAIWVYLTYAALYILEVCLSLPRDSNLVSMAEHTLGKRGKWLTSLAYLFLLYALNTAYLAATTGLFQDIIYQLTGILPDKIWCAIPMIVVFGLLLRRGISMIDKVNRLGMFGLLASFLVLIGLAIPYISKENLTPMQWEYLLPSLSICLTAFGFHVVIPSLVSYLHADVKALKRAIWIGSAVPFVAYLVWQTATVGIVPHAGIQAAFDEGKTGSQLLAFLTESTVVTSFDEIFAFCAIITSFLGVSVSLFDFLVDGLKQRAASKRKWKLWLLAFVPPLYFSLAYKRAFLSALEYAGAFGVVILLALIPAWMVWRKRYVLKLSSSYTAPGGKSLLVCFIAISFCFILLEIFVKAGVV